MTLRPIWQIAYLLPLYPVFIAARAFANWYEGQVQS